MRVLITGSSGSIGSAIVEELRKEHAVVGLDLQSGPATTVCGDLRDESVVDRVAQGVDAIVHVASLHAPHVKTRSEGDFVSTNVDGTRILLDAAKRRGISRFVYTSTTSVYGDAMVSDRAVWVTEDLTPVPRDIYDRTKLAAEDLCRKAASEGDVRCTVIRMSRCFPEERRLMALYRLYRGVDRRDVARAHALALERTDVPFSICNISAQSPFHREDCRRLLEDAPPVLSERCPEAVQEFERRGWPLPKSIDRVYVIDRAQTELGYVPRYGFFEYLKENDATE